MFKFVKKKLLCFNHYLDCVKKYCDTENLNEKLLQK
jgi:hypothetical protein